MVSVLAPETGVKQMNIWMMTFLDFEEAAKTEQTQKLQRK